MRTAFLAWAYACVLSAGAADANGWRMVQAVVTVPEDVDGLILYISGIQESDERCWVDDLEIY